ncbi:hypothetical protein BYT27DRAFT_7340013 [Phlegmacium glaucopus]|nr:hypothetical protein BYT27DRAFT_7340013 [Phlegmacium glaucopus]
MIKDGDSAIEESPPNTAPPFSVPPATATTMTTTLWTPTTNDEEQSLEDVGEGVENCVSLEKEKAANTQPSIKILGIVSEMVKRTNTTQNRSNPSQHAKVARPCLIKLHATAIQDNARPTRRQDSKDKKKVTDAEVLNYWNEHFTSTVCCATLGKTSRKPAIQNGREDVSSRSSNTKKTYLLFLQNTPTAASDEYAKPCEYTFDDKSPYDFVNLNEALKTVGTSAYIGAIQYISNDVGLPHLPLWCADHIKNRLTAPLPPLILATEARHASWINSAVRKQNSWNTAFESKHRLQPYQTWRLSSIKLPHAYPNSLSLLSLFRDMKASSPSDNEPEHLYVAFLWGTATIFAPLSIEDLKAAGTVFEVVVKESMVTGSAIGVFPFDSRGKYPSYSKGESRNMAGLTAVLL